MILGSYNRMWTRDRSGMITIVNAAIVAMCSLLAVFLLNIGHVQHHKVQMQNAADATAITGATVLARGMNTVTATNHVMGEMMSFVLLHEAIGGPRLEGRRPGPADTDREDGLLDAAYVAASSFAGYGIRTPAYDLVRQRGGVFVDYTLLDSKKRLKELLAWVYFTKAAAGAMIASQVPPVVAAGVALNATMDAVEALIEFEYELLKQLHVVASDLIPIKKLLRDTMLPAAKRYTTLVVDQTPLFAERAAKRVAKLNETSGTLFPAQPSLPLAIDPHARALEPLGGQDRVPAENLPPPRFGATPNPREQVVKTSQLVRAAWPWVNYHRKPILDLMGIVFPLAQTKHHYHDWTAGVSKGYAGKLQEKHDLGLYVMAGYPAPDKGFAIWTEDGVRADNMFSLVGLTLRKEPIVYGEPNFFRQTNRDGRLAMAQALVYNANNQIRNAHHIDLGNKRIRPIRQADVGWDTLNWKSGTRPYELVGIGIQPEFPQIEVNWQAKLVPLTKNRWDQVIRSTQPNEFRAILDRLLPQLPDSLSTH